MNHSHVSVHFLCLESDAAAVADDDDDDFTTFDAEKMWRRKTEWQTFLFQLATGYKHKRCPADSDDFNRLCFLFLPDIQGFCGENIHSLKVWHSLVLSIFITPHSFHHVLPHIFHLFILVFHFFLSLLCSFFPPSLPLILPHHSFYFLNSFIHYPHILICPSLLKFLPSFNHSLPPFFPLISSFPSLPSFVLPLHSDSLSFLFFPYLMY